MDLDYGPTISPFRNDNAHVSHPNDQPELIPCDICGYKRQKNDMYTVVIQCDDGVYRCKICRGAGKF